MTEFYDSARFGLIPAGSDAALYVDGRFAVPAADWGRFGKTRGITVIGGASAAAHAGAIDFELYNPAFSGDGLREWALARKAMNCRARVYIDRANLQRAKNLVGDLPNVCYWVSTLQLDNGRQWTVTDLIADIFAVEHVMLTPEVVWAVQFAGGMTAAYDTSLLLGDW